MQIFLFIALIISALAILFAAQNNDPANVSFIVWNFESSLAFIMVVTLATGALVSFLVSLPTNIKVRWALRNQKKKITELEKSLVDANTRADELKQQLDVLTTPPEPAMPDTAPLTPPAAGVEPPALTPASAPAEAPADAPTDAPADAPVDPAKSFWK